jgi:hypothetical protein
VDEELADAAADAATSCCALEPPAGPRVSQRSWNTIALVSLLAGGILVPNIAVGPALTTFLALQLVGYAPKKAIVTGIITGGWVSLVPFAMHLFWLNDVPLQLWVMVLPGVYLGAWVCF